MKRLIGLYVAVVCTVLSFAVHGAYTAQNYVQTGLIGLWDGIENAGWGTHDDAATVWKDLSGVTGDLTIQAAGTIRSNCLEKTSAGVMASQDAFLNAAGIRAVEVVVSAIPSTGWVLPVYVTNRLMVAIKDDFKEGQRGFSVDYYAYKSILTTDHAPIATVSVNYRDSSTTTIGANSVLQNRLSGTILNTGWENTKTPSTFAVGCRTTVSSGNEYAVTGYKVHSIRFYDHELTAEEREQNQTVDCVRYGTTAALPCKWTGGGHDGKFSNAANWKDEIKPRTDFTNLVYLTAQDETTIENDIAPLALSRLYVGRADGSKTALALTGYPFELSSYGQFAWKVVNCTLSNNCPLTVAQDLTFTDPSSSTIFSEGALTLNGDVTVASETFSFGTSGEYTQTLNGSFSAKDVKGTANHLIYFYQPATIRELLSGSGGSCDIFHLMKSGNTIAAASVGYYGAIHAKAADALPTNFVFRWIASSYPTYTAPTTGNYSRYLLYANQTCDRMESVRMTNAVGQATVRNRIGVPSGYSSVLTLKGTADALHYGRLEGALSLVWDPVGAYTQTIADMDHSMTGELIVKGGTLASAGTNDFPSLATLRVKDGATFAVTASAHNAAANPFTGATQLYVSGTGTVNVPAGVTVTFANTFVKGVLQPVGIYQGQDGTDETAKKVDWVTGDGLVSVTACDGTSWAAAADGDWNVAANWSNGLPDGTGPVYLTAEGDNPYKVTMADADAWPNALVIRGANATLAVGADQKIAYDGASVTSSISIEEGGTLSVEGTLILTNYVGTFSIASSDTSVTSRFSVAGTAVYAPKEVDTYYKIAVKTGGAIELPGGELTLIRSGWSTAGGALDLKGGAVSSSDSGSLVLSSITAEVPANTTFDTGSVIFDGCSTFTNAGNALAISWGPQTANESLYVAFRDQARYAAIVDSFTPGRADATTVVDFDSDAEHVKLGYGAWIRASGTGLAEVRVQRGKVTSGGRGFNVGDDNAGATVQHGRFVQTGGYFYNEGENYWWKGDMPRGLTVGYGARATVSSGTVAYGEVYQSGGTNETVVATDPNGSVTLVGVGYGKGSYVQTGGYYWHQSPSAVFGIGAAGGEGLWAVSNGELRVKANAYVGGFYTNLLVICQTMRWPDTRHDATGTLVAAGGTLAFQKNLVLGADGRGTLEVVGADPKLTVGGDLVLSNHVENAASGGTLVYRLANGNVAPVEVTGNLVINAGAKLVVDIGDTLPARRQRLVTATSVIGALDPEDISLIGEDTRKVYVTVGATGVDLRTLCGFSLILK